MAIVTTSLAKAAFRGRAADRAPEGGVPGGVQAGVRGGRVPTAVAVAAVMITVGALSGCGGGSLTPGSVPQAATSTAAGTAMPGATMPGATMPGATMPGATMPGATTPGATTPGTAAARPGTVPVPDGDERKQLVTILEAVNPGVSTDEAALVQTSIGICGHILGGDPGATIAAETRRGFTHGAYTPSPAEIEAMDAAITATFCR